MPTQIENNTSQPMPVRVPNDIESALRELARVRKSINNEANEAIAKYIDRRVFSGTFDAEVAAARKRFGDLVNDLRDYRGEAPVAPLQPPAPVEASKPSIPVGKSQITIRITPTTMAHLTGLALIDDNSIADQIRRALSEHVVEMAKDAVLGLEMHIANSVDA
ncbi:MAG: hypothetical protein J0H23_02425 [Micrococcales bacterium]|nr:hypothetical protein [Micrococcales bacterium]OJX66468.1 MAG: hypothetical protein BGO94_06260 [Micrococcales bacterium 72-143]